MELTELPNFPLTQHHIEKVVLAKTQEGLDFILSHFSEPIWPRTISTRTTGGRQILVFNKQEALARYRQANFSDCRISAFPDYTVHRGTNLQPPNFIMIDLDLELFRTRYALEKSLKNTLKKIEESFPGTQPTVTWTGSGYHVYVLINAFVLEEENIFSKFSRPSLEFLRFAEWYLSNGKSDPAHNATVSFRNCMIRIPGSYNSNCTTEMNSRVEIIQARNNHKPKIKLVLGSFYAYLVDQKIQWNEATRESRYRTAGGLSSALPLRGANSILWIERLLQTPIEDHRKFAVWRILAPYLMNIQRHTLDDAQNVVCDWLVKCNQIKRLDFRPNYYVEYNLNLATRKGYFPISFRKLQTVNRKLYSALECQLSQRSQKT
jgi:hypothetical protein